MGTLNIVQRGDDEGPFVVLPKSLTENDALSYAARGMMAYLLSKPPTWQVRMTDLERRGTEGRVRVRHTFAELEAAGYVKRTQKWDEKGRTYYVTKVYREPQPVEEPAEVADKGVQADDSGQVVASKGAGHLVSNQSVSNQEEEPATHGAETPPDPPADSPPLPGFVAEEEPARGTKKPSAKKERPVTEKPSSPAPGTPFAEWPLKKRTEAFFSAIVSVCPTIDISLKGQRGWVNNAAGQLSRSGSYLPDNIREWYGEGGWYYTTYYGGRNGHKPDPESIIKSIGKAAAWAAEQRERSGVSIGGGAWSIPG
jgi:hypothetical protein